MTKKISFSTLLNSVKKLIAEEEEEIIENKLSQQQKSHQQEIENSIILLAAAVIRCDNNFSSETEAQFLQFLNKQFGNKSVSNRIKAIAAHLETATEPYTKIACKELKLLTTHDSRLHIIKFLFGIAAADDFINAKATRCIHRLAGYLGISNKDFDEIKQGFNDTNNPYYLLGVGEDSSFELIQTAYRKKVLLFHPDKRKS